MTRHLSRFIIVISLLASGVLLAAPSDARAQGFVSGLVGYNFGGSAGCRFLTNCEDKHVNWGGSIGVLGIIGFEEELAYAKNFFGDTSAGDNSILTLMSNLLVAPGIGPVHPYVTGGVGLMRTHTDFTPTQLVQFNGSDNQFAYDLGGGLMFFFGHVGIRGDIRYFHSFQDSNLPLVGSLVGNTEKIDFGRAAASLVVKF